VRDYGHGMDQDGLADEYLPIGRNRRGKGASNVKSKSGKRRVTGRKGLGKLSPFGVASEMQVATFRDGECICLRLSYDAMLRWANEHSRDQPYEPELVSERTGATQEEDGVEVRIRGFHRKKPISEDIVRRGLARRLDFIGPDFVVRVNGTAVQPGDRQTRDACPEGFSWDVTEVPQGGEASDSSTVKGWLGFVERSSQANRGIDIFASRKAVELGSFFNYPSTHAQFARAHLVGEIHADFLDGAEDLIATARNSVVWESEAGLALQAWGHKTLKWAFDKWVELRKQEKETKVIRTAGFDRWLESRTDSERRVADRMVRLLVDDPNLDPSSAAPLLEIVKSSVETVAFRDLVDAIESDDVTPSMLLRLFDEWRVIEAREHLKLADGRVEAMDKLRRYIASGALEVQQIQPLIEAHLWLVDPAWTEADGQTTYTQMLRKSRACAEPKDYEDVDRRLDIMGVRCGGEVCILELKRPQKTLSRRDLDQIERYVDWARTQFSGSGPDAPKFIKGLLVVGKLSTLGDVQQKLQRLAGGDIRVETYGDLHARAREYYEHVEKQLAAIAPEYVRRRKRKLAGPPSQGKAAPARQPSDSAGGSQRTPQVKPKKRRRKRRPR